MSEYSTELEQLLILKPEGRTTVHTFASHPTPLEEKNLGTIFGLFENESTDSLQQEIMEGLAREVVDAFYHAEQFTPDRALEQAVQHLNQKIQTILPEVGDDWVKQFAGVIAVVHGVDVHFSAVGRIAAFIIAQNNIVDLHQPSAQAPQPLKVFSNLMSGKLNQQSSLFFSTETILDFLSKEKLKRIVALKTPQRVVTELNGLLSEDTTNTNFGALVLRIQPTKSLSPANPDIPLIQPEPVRHDSMYDLVNKERTTRDLLAPSLWQSVKRGAAENWQEWRGKEKVTQRPMGEEDSPSKAYTAMPQASTKGVKAIGSSTVIASIWKVTKKALAAIWRGLLVAFSIILNLFRKKPAVRKPLYSSVSSRTTNWVTRLVVWFKSVSLSRKILLISGIVVLFVVAQTVVSKGRDGGSTQKANYEQTIDQVDVKINEAKAAMLYDNEETARTALTQAQTLLDSIPKDSKVYEDQGQSRADSIAQQMNAINHVTVVDSPSVVGNYNSINPSVNVNRIVKLGASLFSFDAGNASIYRLNTEDTSTSVVASSGDSSTLYTSAHKASPGTALLVINNKRLGLLNPVAGSVDDVEAEFPNKDRSVVDAESFGTRLYALDASGGQIVRFQQTDGKYGEGSPWLTDTTVSVTGAKAMAIDGSIYVLQANGAVNKFFAGKPAGDFSLLALSPNLAGAIDITTDENTTNLYVLDPANKRVVILDKTGKLVSQITSPTFDNLKGMVVEEANKIIYLLNGTTVYSVGL
ncbi:MAG: hypothetical protein AAB558_02870 [Patescibacteria group bacterium]